MVAHPLLSQPANRGIAVEGVSRRSALVVGMAASPKAMQNDVNDGWDITVARKGLGFDVELLLDADQPQLSDSIDRCENFVVPIDFDVKGQADAKHQGYSLDRIYERMLRVGSPLNIPIVDACRNKSTKQRVQ